jgi:hypothetical protein
MCMRCLLLRGGEACLRKRRQDTRCYQSANRSARPWSAVVRRHGSQVADKVRFVPQSFLTRIQVHGKLCQSGQADWPSLQSDTEEAANLRRYHSAWWA